MPLAPWLVPPDFLQAAHSGASLGLQNRAQADSQARAYAQFQQANAARQLQAQQFAIQQQMEAQQQAAANAQAAERLRLANDELFQRARADEMAGKFKAEQFDAERQRFDMAQQRQARLEEANQLFGSTLAQGLQGENPDVLGAFAQAAGAAPGAEGVQKLDIDAILSAQGRKQNRGYAEAALIRLEQQTGIPIPRMADGTPEPTAYALAIQKSSNLAQLSKTPMAIRTANSLIDDMESVSGQKMDEAERAEVRQFLVESGGRAPTLTPDQRSALNVAEYGVDGAKRLLDEMKANPKLRFAPGLFTYDVKRGEWIGGPPEASRFKQLFNTLYAGQAFSQGGKALTGTEIKIIRDQIGDPTETNFPQKLATFLQSQTENLGLGVRRLQDERFDIFPRYKDVIGRLSDAYEDSIKNYGIVPSKAFGSPRGRGATNATAAPRVSSKAEYDALPSGAVYVDDSGQTKRKK